MAEQSENELIIVGSGPAGLGVANHIKIPFRILEAEDQPGGLMRSKNLSGYIFDWAGHIFFTGIDRIRDWVLEMLGENFHWQNRESWIFSNSVYTRYPFQANTFGLPLPAVKECLLGLIETTYADQIQPDNFKEWILATYGDGIARHFMLPYNQKLWARDLSSMDHHWLAGRVPRPSLSDFIDGALGPGRKDMGPNARFGYPLRGGMYSLVEKLAKPHRNQITLNRRVTSIDPDRKTVTVEDGTEYGYERLVLTNPLPEIGRITKNLDPGIKSLIESLEYISVLCVNVGVKRPALTEKNWIYFPESEFLFHRIFVQGNTSPNICPAGCFSYTAEITYNNEKPVDFGKAGEQTIDGLIRAGLMCAEDEVEVVDLIDIPVAYVVPTHNRKSIVTEIRKWFETRDIHLAGRFAEWEYFNMDHGLDTGWRLAEKLNAADAPPAPRISKP